MTSSFEERFAAENYEKLGLESYFKRVDKLNK